MRAPQSLPTNPKPMYNKIKPYHICEGLGKGENSMDKRKSTGNIALVLRAIGGYPIMGLALLANVGEGISRVALAANAGAFLDAIIASDYQRMVQLTWLLMAWVVVQFISIAVKDSALGSYLEQGMVRLRLKTVEVLSKTKMSWLVNRHTGELSARISGDLNALSGSLRPILVLSGSAALRRFVTITYLLFLNWRLTLIVFAIAPFSMFMQWVGSKRMKEYRTANQNAVGKMVAVLFDCFGGFESVKSLVLEGEMHWRFDEVQKNQYDALLKEQRLSALLLPFSWVNSYLPQFILIVMGGVLIIQGSLTVGGVLVFLSLASGVINGLGDTFTLFSNIRQLGVHADRIGALWNVPVEESGSIITSNASTAPVYLKNVTYSYAEGEGGNARPILKNVSLTIRPGEFVAVVGASGSGKSTLLKLIASLYEVDEGEIGYYGTPRAQWNVQPLRRNIAYVTQDTYLFPGTLAYNVASGGNAVPVPQVADALATAQLADFVAGLPNGVQTEVGERGVFLSGGQRQRISIARALCKQADILLLDEATSALDARTEEALVSAIVAVQNHPAMLFVTHRIHSARRADRIVVMQDGVICGEGTHQELAESNSEYQRLLAAQEGDERYA